MFWMIFMLLLFFFLLMTKKNKSNQVMNSVVGSLLHSVKFFKLYLVKFTWDNWALAGQIFKQMGGWLRWSSLIKNVCWVTLAVPIWLWWLWFHCVAHIEEFDFHDATFLWIWSQHVLWCKSRLYGGSSYAEEKKHFKVSRNKNLALQNHPANLKLINKSWFVRYI